MVVNRIAHNLAQMIRLYERHDVVLFNHTFVQHIYRRYKGGTARHLRLVELSLVEVQLTIKTPLRNNHAGCNDLGFLNANRSDVNVLIAVVLP